jgi:hypothetical protein
LPKEGADMEKEAGVFTDKEVEHLSDKEKLKEVIRELLRTSPSVKLREDLAKKYKIRPEN